MGHIKPAFLILEYSSPGPGRHHGVHFHVLGGLSSNPTLCLLLSAKKCDAKVAEREICQNPSGLRIHIFEAVVPGHFEPEVVQLDFGTSTARGLEVVDHDCQMFAEFGQFGGIWSQRILYGSGESFYFEE